MGTNFPFSPFVENGILLVFVTTKVILTSLESSHVTHTVPTGFSSTCRVFYVVKKTPLFFTPFIYSLNLFLYSCAILPNGPCECILTFSHLYSGADEEPISVAIIVATHLH